MKKENFIGKWEIQRTVRTFQKKELAKMKGIGIFEYLDKKELIYSEKLMNHTQDSSACVARKAYRYRFLNESIYIYFHKEEKERLAQEEEERIKNERKKRLLDFCSPFKYKLYLLPLK